MILIYIFTNLLVLSMASPLKDITDKTEKSSDIATFWQFTDIHWDLKYSKNGDPNSMCHTNGGSSQKNKNGDFGNYLCDSPWNLVQSAMEAMQQLQSKPEFILWTGDNAPHSTDPMPDFEVIFKTMNNLTEELTTRFPGVQIIPVLGNHDAYPKDYFPSDNQTFYDTYLVKSGLKAILNEEAQKEFSNGGYFSARVSPILSVLSVNTNLYYRYNSLGTQNPDPTGQFYWMKSKLIKARKSEQKIIIAAHAPPGYFERNGLETFFNETYNEAYVDLLSQFGDVIVAQIYGHEHTDSFRLFNSQKGKESVAFLAPSVTPWFPAGIPSGTAINPSVRLYSYNSSNILDYHQYHLNLTEANNDLDEALWKLYYQATLTFSVPSLNADSMNSFLGKLGSDDSLLQTYYRINSAGVEHPRCSKTCKRIFLCTIDHLRVSNFEQCIAPNTDQFHTTDYFDTYEGSNCNEVDVKMFVLMACVITTITLMVMFGVVLVHRKKTGSIKKGRANRQGEYKEFSNDTD